MRRHKRYSIRAGYTRTVKLQLTSRRMRKLRRAKRLRLFISARNADAVEGTYVRVPVTIKRPLVKKAKKRRR